MKFKEIELVVRQGQRIEQLRAMYEMVQKAQSVFNFTNVSFSGEDSEFLKAAEAIRGEMWKLQQAIYREKERVQGEHFKRMMKFYEEEEHE